MRFGNHRHGFGRHGHGHSPREMFAMAFGRGGWEGGRGWGGREGGRRRVFDSGELRLVLLKLIADEPRHGYDLIRAIEELTGGAYAPSPGVVYPTVTMLQDMGLIEEAKAEGARKAYAVTPEGTAHIEENRETIDALLARLAALGVEQKKSEGSPSVRRAMHNLRHALRDRIMRDDADMETMHEVAAILDEAAQKIERL